MKAFGFSSKNNSSEVADKFAPFCSSAKNNKIVVDTVVAVSILLFVIISIMLICDKLLNVIIISGLIVGLEKVLKKQTEKFSYLI